MSGGDVALYRRSRANRPSANADNEQFARSMLQVAETHLAHGDQATAKWLTEWAQRLANDQVDAEHRTRIGGDVAEGSAGVAAASGAVRPSLFSRAPHSPAKVAGDDMGHSSLAFVPNTWSSRRSREGTFPINPVAGCRDGHSEVRGDISATEIPTGAANQPTESTRRPRTPDEPPGDDEDDRHTGASLQIASGTCTCDPTSGRIEQPPRSETALTIDDAERLVAAVARNGTAGDPDGRFYREPPVHSGGRPVTLDVISFAAGIVSCAAVCIALCFLPRRATGRKAAPPVPTATEVRATARPIRNEQDVGSQIIEEFFDSNVELYRELAKTGSET